MVTVESAHHHTLGRSLGLAYTSTNQRGRAALHTGQHTACVFVADNSTPFRLQQTAVCKYAACCAIHQSTASSCGSSSTQNKAIGICS